MAEKRICPVCESEIPQHTRFTCPKCYFDLSRLEDEKAIAEAKNKFLGTKLNPSQGIGQSKPATTFIDYLTGGFLGGSIPWIVAGIIFDAFSAPLVICSLPIILVTGVLVGFFGKRLEEKDNTPNRTRFSRLLRAFIISVLFSSLTTIWFFTGFILFP